MTGFIDEFEPAWLDRLDAIAAQVPSGHRLLLLLDAAFLPGVTARLHALGAAPHLVFEHLGETRADALAVSPCVVAHRPGRAAFRAVLRDCDTRPMVTALVTRETPDRLAARLARWVIVQVTDSAFHLRLADTRRLPALAGALRPEQLADAIGPVAQWRCIGRDGRWQELPRPAWEKAPPRPPFPQAASLDDAQFATLVQDSEADELLAVLAPELPQVWSRTRPSWRHRHAQDALRAADARGQRHLATRLSGVRDALVRASALAESEL